MTSDPRHDTDALWAGLDKATSAFAKADRADDAVAAVLEAIGRLLASGAPERDVRARVPRSLGEDAIRRALAREALVDALESNALGAVSALSGDGEQAPMDLAIEDRTRVVLACFEARTRAEMEAIGASFAGAAGVVAGGEARLTFDLTVRPLVFELTAFNHERAAIGAAIAPAYRDRFWWWFEGLSIDPRAAGAMGAVASLVARFPEARAHFDRLVTAEQGWAAAHREARAKPVAKVIRLRDWIERRAAGERAGLALAAALLDEVLLLETADAHVSWSPPAVLIVDLLADRRPSSVPELIVGSVAVPGAAVSGAEERFAFSLPEGALDEARVSLRLPLVRGDVVIDLPAPDPA